jgi:virginiamycin B lyase
MYMSSWPCRLIAATVAVLFIAGCASLSGTVPSGGGYATSSRVHSEKRTVTFYITPSGYWFPEGITSGPDAALWFSAPPSVIGRITTAGQYTMETNVGVDVSTGITVGPDDALWFTAQKGSAATIGRMTTSGQLTLFDDAGGSSPQGITTGPDGALWFAESNGKVGRMTTDGNVEHFTIAPSNAELMGIVTGPDGNLWVTQPLVSSYGASDKVYRLTTQGRVKSYTVAKGPTLICVGRDRALWFTETDVDSIGRLTTKGALTQYPTGLKFADPWGIAAGPDGALWFTNRFSPYGVGRITVSGKIKLIRTKGPGEHPELFEITSGPDGAMWFTNISDPIGVGRVTTK